MRNHPEGIAPSVRNILNYKKSGTVLDLGSGKGRHAIFLAKQGFAVTAVDYVEERLAEMKARARIEGVRISIKRADISHFSFSRKYDIIMASMSLHFLQKNQIAQVVKRMKAHTKQGGLNVVSVLTNKEEMKANRAYLFKTSELKRYYTDWNILEYEEKLSQPFFSEKQGKRIRQHRAVIIASKPPYPSNVR
ncbi:methyltransferase domain-containing protein [Candidatus Uhrbacteria bacterium]|nr:methyltransferase domain-containing protein [Candidatus Uhrbacteria bacterium]